MTYAFLFTGKALVKDKKYYSVSPDVAFMVFGNSHPECAFNDSLISGCKNMARSGEAYFYSYFKIKKLIENNPHVKKIVLEFSNNQVSADMNDWIWADNFLKNEYPRYSRFMTWDDYKILLEHNAPVVIESEPLRLKGSFTLLFNRKANFIDEYNWGGYLFNNRNKTDSLILAQKASPAAPVQPSLSETNLEYLQKIVACCKQNKVELFLIRCPLHPAYPLDNEPQFKKLLKDQLAGINFLDFKNFTLENSKYGDLEHLNYKGANEFSLFFNGLVQQGLFTIPAKQALIDQALAGRPKNGLYSRITKAESLYRSELSNRK